MGATDALYRLKWCKTVPKLAKLIILMLKMREKPFFYSFFDIFLVILPQNYNIYIKYDRKIKIFRGRNSL
jgi:hypothetical protein